MNRRSGCGRSSRRAGPRRTSSCEWKNCSVGLCPALQFPGAGHGPTLHEEVAHLTEFRVAMFDQLVAAEGRQVVEVPLEIDAEELGRGVGVFVGTTEGLGDDAVNETK